MKNDMKRQFTAILLSALMLVVCSVGASAADRVITVGELPQRAQTFVKKYFNVHKVVLVKEDRGFRDVDYEVKFTDGSEIEFDGRGEWTEVKSPKGLKKGIVPVQIQEFLKHRGYLKHGVKAVKIEYGRRGYEVKLSNGTELEFDRRFNLVDVDH